ncbi:MAG: C25 family cysteine peptidase, partial [Anaerolineae bacterium]|nr:C25 family cysteine peptidase [Thermoflexales bacterium]MDW8407305.1 C25 family cysteine peptidase [Anaerolineae bacterium]
SAYTRTLKLFNDGAGIIEFAGHGHPLQFAGTAPFHNPFDNTPASYLLSSADPNRLSNTTQLPIVLFMACNMGRFHVTPSAAGGQTLAERLIFSPNGAVAVWASSGKGVLYGHLFLQQGFYRALWSAAPFSARLGDLTRAGQRELISNADFLSHMAQTHVLLGDAAMRVRVAPTTAMSWPYQMYVPAVFR